MRNGFFVFAGFYFFGLLIRTVYERLKKTGRIDPKNRFVFATVFCAMILLWIGWFNMGPLDPLRISVPPIVKWLGFGVFMAGLVSAVGAAVQLRGVENIDHLATKGFFSKIRHPMYFGFILWIFGWVMFHGAVISLLAGSAAIAGIYHWRKAEEKELRAVYGEVYAEYKKRTWF